MPNTFRNVAAVIVLTLFTALAVFATVQLTDRLLGPAPAVAAQTTASGAAGTAAQTLVCPATGCTASTCHAVQ